jgi:hypothetical protein
VIGASSNPCHFLMIGILVFDGAFELVRGGAAVGRRRHLDAAAVSALEGFSGRYGQLLEPDGGGYEKYFRALHDSAWELCRIGVLRPGRAERYIGVGASELSEAGYSITQSGRIWLKATAARPIVDPSRLGQALAKFSSRFGPGYSQRATEAVRTYRTCNYLSACVMSGAAAESVLLALAVGKVRDEGKVLAEYKSSSGRRRINDRVLEGISVGLQRQFEAAAQALHYWRDDAGHGTMTSIDEIDAHASLTQLLRLAQMASDHWTELTA